MGRQRDQDPDSSGNRSSTSRSASPAGGGGRPPSLRPSKVCPICSRPFTWRRKWASVWDEVIYCSDRCRNRRSERQG